MAEDRLHLLDVDVSVEAPTRIGSRILEGDSYIIAVCHKTRVVVIANGRFVDLYGVCYNSLHPFTFQQQISIGDHVTRLPSSILGNTDDPELNIVVATCVTFPVPGFLLVGAFVEVPESEISRTGDTSDPNRTVLLLGFRLYAGSATQFVGVVDGDKVPASVQVYFSFVEPVVGTDVKSIRSLQSFQRDMTPDQGSVMVLFEDSKMFGVLNWRERFSDREMCLAQMKQLSDRLVVAECSSDGRYLVVGDAGGRLFLLDFKDFSKSMSARPQQIVGGKRLELGPCSCSGVLKRDNPLENVRLVHTSATASMNCAYTVLRWWVSSVRDQQKQFVLAGKQDGSLSILKLIQGNDEARSTAELKLIQMYPGLASGTHDAVRSISEPIKCTGDQDTWFEFCILSKMRWRTWRIKIAEGGEGDSQRNRMLWPSVRDSLDFPSYAIQSKAVRGTVQLSSSTDFSRLIAKALSDSCPDHTTRFPISLTVADSRLQVIGVLTKTWDEVTEASSESGNSAHDHDESENDGKMIVHDVTQEESTIIDTATRLKEKHHPSGPTTIQGKYKLPPMEWKTRSSASGAANLDKIQPTKKNGQQGVSPKYPRMSKFSRVDYNERVTSVMQRVETLNGVMKSMRTSFQLFSSDVQQHMNFVSEQLEEISSRRVTRETAQPSRIG